MSTPDLIPTSEASRMLNESVRQVNRRVERGELREASKLPGLRGARLFDRETILALVPEERAS